MRLIFIAPLLGLVGCAVGGTNGPYDASRGTGRILSADNRAIVVMPNVNVLQRTDGGTSPASFQIVPRTVVCAEPQADAIRAVAQELAAGLKASSPVTGGTVAADASLAAAAREAVGSMAQRTPTVQLMRDTLYRACEGVMNGVLDTSHVEFIASRIDNIMVALHAIDGLTNAPNVAPIAITVPGSATATPGGTTTAGATTVNLTSPNAPTRSPLDANNANQIAASVVCIVALSLFDTERVGRTDAKDFCAPFRNQAILARR